MWVRREYKHSREEVVERTFKCERCGARGEVAFVARGESQWNRESWLGGDDPMASAVEQSENDLRNQASSMLGFVRCPTCGERRPGAIGWAMFRVGFWATLAAIAVVAGDAAWVYYSGAAATVLAGVQTWRETRRLRGAERAVFRRLTPGSPSQRALPAAKPPAPRRVAPDLPVARVVSAPAQVKQEPIDPSAGPQFLGKDSL